jgi:hypothetical protein
MGKKGEQNGSLKVSRLLEAPHASSLKNETVKALLPGCYPPLPLSFIADLPPSTVSSEVFLQDTRRTHGSEDKTSSSQSLT